MTANPITFSFSREGNCTMHPDSFFDEMAVTFCQLVSAKEGLAFEESGFSFIADKRGAAFWASRMPLNAVKFVDGTETRIYSEESRKLPWNLYRHVLAGRVAKLKAQMV